MEYFKILGVSKDATDGQIKKAYYKLAARYHPDHLSPELAKQFLPYFLKVTKAYLTLKDRKKRSEYIRQCQLGIFEEEKERDRKNSREKLFEQGLKLLMADPIRSSKYFKKALSLEQNNQTYKSYYGLSLILSGNDNKGIDLCLEAAVNEDTAENHLNLAKCYAKLGQYRNALNHSKKALQLDKNNLEARNFVEELKNHTGIRQFFNRK
jgi:tetratricopeptide (TPR) repeat protein